MFTETLKSAHVVAKRALDKSRFRRQLLGYPNARTALRAYLASAGLKPGDRILLPAYVGWSPNEGSGIFDPVRALELTPVFYEVDNRLNLNLADFTAKTASHRPKAVLLVHFFGRVDPAAAEASMIARANDALVVEDAAHALFTMMVSGSAGHLGDATILSLHKMLPVQGGGALLVSAGPAPSDSCALECDLWEYDLARIAACRVANAERVTELVRPLQGEVDLLWATWPTGHVPQTVPVMVRNCSRYQVYRRMNESGFGVVSLYHTLISQISRTDYPVSHDISDHILNIPVHQDVAAESFAPMIQKLREIVIGR